MLGAVRCELSRGCLPAILNDRNKKLFLYFKSSVSFFDSFLPHPPGCNKEPKVNGKACNKATFSWGLFSGIWRSPGLRD